MSDFDESKVVRDERGRFADKGGGPGPGQIFASAPLATNTAEAKVWRKSVQHQYANDLEFRALADAVTLYTQGEYDILRQGTAVLNGGVGVEPIAVGDRALKGVGFYDYKNFITGQNIDSSSTTTLTFNDGVKALANGIRTSEPVNQTLYRGLHGYQQGEALLKLQPGDVFHVPGATSFTSDESMAVKWANNKGAGTSGYKLSDADTRIIIELEPGVRGIKASALSPYKQSEVITAGAFEVVHVHDGLNENRTREIRLRLRNVGYYKPESST